MFGHVHRKPIVKWLIGNHLPNNGGRAGCRQPPRQVPECRYRRPPVGLSSRSYPSDLLDSDWSAACVSSGRNSVRKYCVNERVTRCAPGRIVRSHQLRSVVQAALAGLVLALFTIGFSAAMPARAGTAASAAISAARMRMDVWRYALRQRGKPYIYGDSG